MVCDGYRTGGGWTIPAPPPFVALRSRLRQSPRARDVARGGGAMLSPQAFGVRLPVADIGSCEPAVWLAQWLKPLCLALLPIAHPHAVLFRQSDVVCEHGAADGVRL